MGPGLNAVDRIRWGPDTDDLGDKWLAIGATINLG